MAENTRHRATIRDLGDGRVGIWAAFEHKDRLKALPSARWSPHLKCWHVDAMFRHEAQQLVDRLNGGLNVALTDALGDMFREIPARLHQPTYKALLKVWHPDARGDTAATQALTTAWRERPTTAQDLL